MAVFDIPIEVPDAKVTDLIDAMRWRHGQVEDLTDPENPVMRDQTVAELRAIIKTDVVDNLKNCVVRHKKFLAAETAASTITPPDIV